MAFDFDRSLVGANHRLNHAQAKTEPVVGAAFFASEETIKYSRKVLGRDAHSGVRDSYGHPGLGR